MNPFESPSDTPDAVVGSIDAMAAIRTGVAAGLANWSHLLAVWLLLGVAYFASCCSLVLWVPVLPMMFWGVAAWILQTLDGQRGIPVLWQSPMASAGTAIAQGWGFMLLMFAVGLPVYLINVPLGMYTQSMDPNTATLTNLVGSLPVWVWAAITVRLTQGWWYVVEGRCGVIDALSRSWNDTRGSAWQLAAMALAWSLLMLPYQVVSTYVSSWYTHLPLGQQLENMPLFNAVLLGGAAVAGLAGMVYFLALGAAYRQLHPTAPDPG